MIAEYKLDDKKNRIISKKVKFKNNRGLTIIGYFDYLERDNNKSKVIIIPPAYGEIKKDYISTSYYLVSNGFAVLRYDATNHIGESDNNIVNFTMSSMEDDLKSAIYYVEKTWNVKNYGIVSTSLSSRVVFRVAAQNEDIKFIISLVGVINLQNTLKSVYNEDMFRNYLRGKRWGVTDILGFEVSDYFIQDSLLRRYHTLSSTTYDMEKAKCKIVYIEAGKDVWVDKKDLRKILKKIKGIEYICIKKGLHHLEENPKIAKQALVYIVIKSLTYIDKRKSRIKHIIIPPIHTISFQNKIETNILKKLFPITKVLEREFWSHYLTTYNLLFKSNDYQNLLSFIIQLFDGIQLGDSILDAGCGDGHLVSWILFYIKKQFFSYGKTFSKSINIVNLDYIEKALENAAFNHSEIISKVFKEKEIGLHIHKFLNLKYILEDLENDNLKYTNFLFNKICCNLVLSYVKSPAKVVKNLAGFLSKNGKLIISSLKPNYDLSLIYRRFANKAINKKEIEKARKLLTEAGKIKYKGKHGHYVFFTEDQLSSLLHSARLRHIKTFRAFGNQANVVIGER